MTWSRLTLKNKQYISFRRTLPKVEDSDRGAVPEFLASGVCLDDTFTHTLCFLVTVENKVHIVSTVWWLQWKFMRVIQSKFIKIFRGARARRAGPGSALEQLRGRVDRSRGRVDACAYSVYTCRLLILVKKSKSVHDYI